MANDFPFDHFFKASDKSHGPKQTSLSPKHGLPGELDQPSDAPVSVMESAEDSEKLNSEELRELTDEILTSLKTIISPHRYKTFFKGAIKLIRLGEERATFEVTTKFIKKMIDGHYKDELKASLEDALGRDYEVDLVHRGAALHPDRSNPQAPLESKGQYEVSKSSSVSKTSFRIMDPDPKLKESQEDLMNQVETRFLHHIHEPTPSKKIDPTKTFESFVVGPSNNMAHASSLASSKDPGVVYPSLYIHGNSGLGKTHLIHATANKIAKDRPELRICITTANEFMNEMLRAIQDKNIQKFRKKYTESVDVLMIDDIHELKNRPGTQNEFFHVFNDLHKHKKQLIFTSDKHPKEIPGIEERIRTRLSWGLVVEIQLPDFETRMAILKKKAADEDMFLPEDVITLIASCIKTNIRELEGSLIKLGAYSSLFKVDIDIDLARDQLKLSEDDEHTYSVSVESVVHTVARHFEVPEGDLRGKSRQKNVTFARHVAMYLSYYVLKATLQDIGEYFGNRDHTTVLHAVNKLRRNMASDPTISQTLFDLESQITV